MIARRAASEIEPMMATGIAINRGHGVATTITARNRTGSYETIHAATPKATTSGV